MSTPTNQKARREGELILAGTTMGIELFRLGHAGGGDLR
jgi:hypothetical protein